MPVHVSPPHSHGPLQCGTFPLCGSCLAAIDTAVNGSSNRCTLRHVYYLCSDLLPVFLASPDRWLICLIWLCYRWCQVTAVGMSQMGALGQYFISSVLVSPALHRLQSLFMVLRSREIFSILIATHAPPLIHPCTLYSSVSFRSCRIYITASRIVPSSRRDRGL